MSEDWAALLEAAKLARDALGYVQTEWLENQSMSTAQIYAQLVAAIARVESNEPA